MRTIRTRAGEALSEQEKALFSEISEKIGRRFRRTVLIWLGVTVWFAVLLGVLTYFRSRISPLFTVSLVIAAGIFVLWIMVSITEQKWDDGLPPAPQPETTIVAPGETGGSGTPLTEADLVPTNFDAQCKLASSPLHSREVIGYGSEKQHAK